MSKTTFNYKKRFLAPGISKCVYCSEILYENNCVTDHIIPKSKGGKSNDENFTLACSLCNRLKWDMSIEDFKKWIENRLHLLKVEFRIKNRYYNRILNG